MQKIKYSFIVPVYNVENDLRRCLDSVLNQTEGDFEVIIIDDGSTDNSSNICDEYNLRYSNVTVFHTTNKGSSAARNLGILNAKGDFISFIDSDDYIELDFISKVNKILEREVDLDILTGNLVRYKHSQKFYHIHNRIDGVVDGLKFLKVQLANNNLSYSSTRNLYSKSFIVNNKLFFKENTFYEDGLWIPLVFIHAKRVFVSDILFYNYVVREGSVTQQKDKTKLASDLLNITNDLIPIYQSLKDEQLKIQLNKELLKNYFIAFKRGKHFSKKYHYDLKFMKDNASGIKTKIQVFIFSKSRYIYYYLIRLRKPKIVRNVFRFIEKRPLIETNHSINRSVLLLGSGRSGTTWLSLQIVESGRFRYIVEPFRDEKNGYFNELKSSKHVFYKSIVDKANFRKNVKYMLMGKMHSTWMDRHNKKWITNGRLIKLIRGNLLIPFFQEEYPKLPIIYLIRSPFQVVHSSIEYNFSSDFKDVINNDILLNEVYFNQKDLILNIYDEGKIFEKHLLMWCIQNHFALKNFKESYHQRIVIYDEIFKGSKYELELIKNVTGRAIKTSHPVFKKESFTSNHVGSNEERLQKWKRKFSKEEINRMISILKQFNLDQIIDFNDYTINREKLNAFVLDA